MVTKFKYFFVLNAFIALLIFSASFSAQSRDQMYPTAITSTELSGVIKARDIGDPRLTSYYYAFEGTQGDIFINVVAKNFSGDIDVFTQDTLRPLTKIVIYADSSMIETGRLIYLRKGEKLLLRVQGRTPNDDPATFRIKFGGSFVALKPTKDEGEPFVDGVAGAPNTIVNSVGTIVEVRPKSTPAAELPLVSDKISDVANSERRNKVAADTATSPGQSKVVTSSTSKEPLGGVPGIVERSADAKATADKPVKRSTRPEKKPDPLAGIRLIFLMKDGTQIERPMTEVLRFSVNNGVLTVVSKKNGAVAKYSILDVSRVTIE